jgi:hypothetical protein|tara:strand:+ start:587 stop:838 length:252 start_codon:yes stop_codon:yes gene_type:complete
MILFARKTLAWFNKDVKNVSSKVSDKIISKYLGDQSEKDQNKSTNINILLNRIELNNKNETRKKLYFSAAASTGLVLFGLLIF